MFAAAPEEGAAGGRKSLVAALAAVGFGGYSGCIAARAVKALAAEEFPSDAMWLDRLPQLNALASALNVRAPLLQEHLMGHPRDVCNSR